MASPQLENGFSKIANEIIDQFCQSKNRFSGEEWIMLWIVLRKTYGWKKIEDSISLSQFYQISGMKKPSIIRALKKLEQKKVISKKANGRTNKWQFIKDYHQWQPLAKKLIVSKKANESLAKKLHTKETIQKKVVSPIGDPNMRNINESSFSDSYEIQIDAETGEETKISPKVPNSMFSLMKWAEERRGKKFANPGKQFKAMKMAKQAKRGPEAIKRKWKEMENESFWSEKGFDFMNVINELDKEHE